MTTHADVISATQFGAGRSYHSWRCCDSSVVSTAAAVSGFTTRLYSLPEMKTWSVPVFCFDFLLVKDLNDEFLSNEVK